MSKYVPLRIKNISFLIDKRTFTIVSILLALIIFMIITSVGTGQMRISPIEVTKALFGSGLDMHALVIKSFRMPRILLALLAGMALAVSGAILQGIIRNPLASPDIIGITGGGALATITFLTMFNGRGNSLTVSIHWMPLASFLGALIIGFLVYLLAWRNGVSPIRLILIGIGIAAALQALTNLTMILGPIHAASQANIWITGSVHGANWQQVWILLPWFILFMIFIIIYAHKLNVQELGDDIAKGLGSALQRDRFALLFISTALAGGAVAFAGGIGFVGLMAPHIARRLVGSSFGGLVIVSALVGGLIVIAADLIARTAFAPLEVPAGVFTSAVGAPYFIYLLYRSRNK